MKKYKWVIVLLNLVLLLIYFNYSIVKKEDLLKDGDLVLLELAPVDPRSLMQGDYMNLSYKFAENIAINKLSKRGYCVIALDENNEYKRVRFQQGLTPLNKGEYLINYTKSDGWNVYFGAESFFFQEGDAKKYEKAKYGGLKLDKEGNSLLVGLYDENKKQIN